MNIQTIEARLRKIDRQRERLSKQLEARREALFKALPARVGLRSVDQLIQALAAYAAPRGKSRPGGNGASAGSHAVTRKVAKKASAKKSGRRRQYTDHQKAQVKAALAKGDKTVGQISKELGVSSFSIKDWKEQWGMTKKRRRSAAKKK